MSLLEFKVIIFLVESIEFNNNIFSKWGKTHKIILGVVFSDSKDILKIGKLINKYYLD